MNITVAVVLALVSIAAYAVAAATQHRVASANGLGLRRLLTNSAWWASNAANATGAALHVAALKYGPLTLVQCLGALTVVAAVPLAARGAGRRVGRGEWHGIALTLAGFAALLPLTTSGDDSSGVLTTPAALAVAVTASLVVPLALSIRTSTGHTLALAAASGVVSGTGSALTQTVLHADSLLTWQTALVAAPAVALAVIGLLLSQTAYTGGLGAPLATLTIANPLAASAIGLTLLGERIHGGLPGTALALTGTALAARGILLLARPSTSFPATDNADTPAAHGLVCTAPTPRPTAAFHRHPHLSGVTELEGRAL
ncbi:DMT family transporter [Streptomyces guryensis]|uniref:DMT family transporter n=1 Tax=Streptomyces guryensis TaxID=2886947 RepID=A0A9Q3Z8Y1_9ACTN|nr:DMT family transporter [Streptomyces guryensis]MCD9879716.1 DMT family transporter [Streptomyces guryensis]